MRQPAPDLALSQHFECFITVFSRLASDCDALHGVACCAATFLLVDLVVCVRCCWFRNSKLTVLAEAAFQALHLLCRLLQR